jgi:hypothetical protein
MVGIRPVVWSSEVFELPEPESNKGHEAEPYALIDSVESNSVEVSFFEEPSDFVESIDGLVFHKSHQ